MRNYSGIVTKPFIGQPVSFPISLDTPKNQRSHALSLTINWEIYGSNGLSDPYASELAIGVNLQQGVVFPLDKIRSVYIDNSNSDITAVVYFADTQMTVIAGARQTVWLPVVTNLVDCILIGQQFLPGTQPSTRFIFCNIAVPPFANAERPFVIDKWAGTSPDGLTIATRDRVAIYRPPALGDIVSSIESNLLGDFVVFPIAASPYPSGYFLYLTHFNTFAFYDFTVTASEETFSRIELIYNDTNEIILQSYIQYIQLSSIAQSVNPVINLQGTQLRLDASRPIALRIYNSRAVSSTPFRLPVRTQTQLVYSVHFDENVQTSAAPLPSPLPATITFVSSNSNAADNNQYSFAAQNIGPAYTGRVLLVSIWGRGGGANNDILSVTIDGQQMFEIVKQSVVAANSACGAIYGMRLDTGISGTIAVLFNQTQARVGFMVHALNNVGGSAVSFNTAKTSGVDGLGAAAVNLSAEENSVALAFSAIEANVVVDSWTGLTQTATLIVDTNRFTSAAGNTITGNNVISVDYAGTNPNAFLVAASFSPKTL